MKTNRMALSTAAGLAALSLGLAGCTGSGSGNGGDDTQDTPAADSSSGNADEATDDKDQNAGDDGEQDSTHDSSGRGLPADADLSKDTPAVSADDAIETAKKEVGDGIVYGIELDWDEKDGAWQYDVSILDGATDHDVEIDADSGQIVEHEQDSTDDREEPIDLNDPMTVDDD